ncbi:hypothetical protein, partial [Stenotrophomonas maltophilia]|uniref:hypothetical protein n=1 Tax=Stenotrophomonas maltophilia TaxID=40324 RepID=UPI001C4340BC
LGRRIHAAHAPSTGPTPPSTVSCDLSKGLSALVGADRWSALGWISMSYGKIVSTKVDTYQQPPLPVDPRHAWMNSFDI